VPARFVRKLEKFEKLARTDRQAILDLVQSVRKIGAREVVDTGDWSYLFMSGLACRYQLLEDGSRQITDFIVPGDFVSGDTALQDWGIATLTQCSVAYLPHDRLADALQERPHLAAALWRLSCAQASVLREWTANIGRRPADRRVAHVLCELCLRLEAFEPRTTAGFVLPLSQVDLADATALSSVHINRVLGRLRDRRLLTLQRRSIIVKDLKRIMAYAQFNDSYLRRLLSDD